MSVDLTSRSVDSTPLLRVTSTSKKLTFSLDQSAVNLIVGWNQLIALINSFSDSSLPYRGKKSRGKVTKFFASD